MRRLDFVPVELREGLEEGILAEALEVVAVVVREVVLAGGDEAVATRGVSDDWLLHVAHELLGFAVILHHWHFWNQRKY